MLGTCLLVGKLVGLAKRQLVNVETVDRATALCDSGGGLKLSSVSSSWCFSYTIETKFPIEIW